MPFGKVEGQEANALRSELEPIPELHGFADVLAGSKPEPLSTAILDAQLPLGTNALMYAIQNVQGAADHLLAWYGLLIEARHIPAWAHATLTRTAIEAAPKARWLIDVHQTSVERAARGAQCQLESWLQARRFARSNPDSEELVRTIDADIRALRFEMDANGYPASEINTTQIAKDYGSEWSWRLTSGIAHSLEWAMMVGALETDEPPLVDGQRRVNAQVPPEAARALTRAAVDLLTTALNEIVVYMSGPSPMGFPGSPDQSDTLPRVQVGETG